MIIILIFRARVNLEVQRRTNWTEMFIFVYLFYTVVYLLVLPHIRI